MIHKTKKLYMGFVVDVEYAMTLANPYAKEPLFPFARDVLRMQRRMIFIACKKREGFFIKVYKTLV